MPNSSWLSLVDSVKLHPFAVCCAMVTMKPNAIIVLKTPMHTRDLRIEVIKKITNLIVNAFNAIKEKTEILHQCVHRSTPIA